MPRPLTEQPAIGGRGVPPRWALASSSGTLRSRLGSADVQAVHAERAAITVDDLIDKLERLYFIAVDDRQPGPGVKAVSGSSYC